MDLSLANASARLPLGFYYLHIEDAVANMTSGCSAKMTVLLHSLLESADTELCYKGDKWKIPKMWLSSGTHDFYPKLVDISNLLSPSRL